jgi:hypothetical protein
MSRVWLSPRWSARIHVIVPRRCRASKQAGEIMPAYAPARCASQRPTCIPSRITSPARQPAVRILYPIPPAIPKHLRVSRNTSQPCLQTKVSSDNLEFLQRPNGDSDLPVAAPTQPLGGGDPAPKTEPVKAPEHHEESRAPAPAPSTSEKKPAQESKSNGTPVESKPAQPQSGDMSYADMAAKGPKQTDEEKCVIIS